MWPCHPLIRCARALPSTKPACLADLSDDDALLVAVFEDLVVVSEGKVHSVGNADVGSATEGDKKARATIKEACPKCGHPELEYYTMQLRSADEGQTVFYNCVKCGHTFNTNT